MADREVLTAAYLRSILHYDPDTGVFTWRERPREHFVSLRGQKVWNSRYAGTVAGFMLATGYLMICIDYRKYLLHRLAWLYMTGEWPIEDVDHADLNKVNNRFENLREATRSQNMANKKMRCDNTSGYKGVKSRRRKWIASICINKKQIHLGVFSTKEAASAAYARAASAGFGEFGRIE